MDEALNGPRGPFVKDQLEQLFVAADNGGKKIGALFGAIVKKEDITPVPEGEELLKYDTTSERGKLQLDQDITAFQHQETLDAVGLKFQRNVFRDGFCIKDGERFVTALTTIPETSDILKVGLNRIMVGFLHNVSYRFVPDSLKFDDDTFRKHRYVPQLQKNMEKDDPTGEHALMAVEVIMRADDIMAQFERLDVNKQTLRDFDALRVAELEDMLPEWAEAFHWGLFTPPTEEDRHTVWAQWEDENKWTAYFQYLDSCKAKAPADSKFMALIANGMNDNISRMRKGELEPEDEFRRAKREERKRNRDANRANDEEINAAFDSYHTETEQWAREQQEKWQKKYDHILAGVQLRLQSYLQ